MPSFSKASLDRLAGAHPDLQKVMHDAIQTFDFMVLDSQRGRAAQELAFKQGNSKAHFGQSAHNWAPSVALDIAPYPLDWKDTARFKAMAAVVKASAKKLGVPLEWGGDWKSLVDMPHFELSPWREYAKKSKPYGE